MSLSKTDKLDLAQNYTSLEIKFITAAFGENEEWQKFLQQNLE
jgi:hypothetical protein